MTTNLDAKNAGKIKQIKITALKRECFACRDCEIGHNKIDNKYRPQVFARGNVNAKIVVLGQNPGKKEVLHSLPFVGPAGQVLNSMLDAIGIDPKLLYISNTVKCFTPENRLPTSEEITACKKFIQRELDIVRPLLVVTLGNPALERMTGRTGINICRGSIIKSKEFGYNVFPLLHPSSLLYDQENVPKMEEDLLKLKEILHEIIRLPHS